MATITMATRVDSNLVKEFDRQAHKQGYSRAEAVREAMRRFIQNGGLPT